MYLGKEVAVEPMPTVILKNGLRVGNHSSPHEFQFDDGSVLPACSPERADHYKLIPLERNEPSPSGRWTDIDLEFTIPAEMQQSLIDNADRRQIDVVLVALPVLICVREHDWFNDKASF
jgi:hypothetical protein